jgi:hypothetical protein
MERRRLLIIGASLAANGLVSWTLLPLVIPPYHGYSLAQLLDVLFWQGIGTVGWPLAVIGAVLLLPFSQSAVDLESALLLLLYPAMLILLIRVLVAKALRRWELPLLHLLLTFSFAAVWFRVLNGYSFMAG